MKKITIAGAICILILAAVAADAAAFSYWACGSKNVAWKTNSVRMRAADVSFPSGNPFTADLQYAINAWDRNPSRLDFTLTLNDASVALGNGQNEIWFSSDQNLLDGSLAVTYTQMDCDDLLYEADIVFDVEQPLTTSTVKTMLNMYSGCCIAFETLAMHELGHALGLRHETRTHNIMLGLWHNHTNGNTSRGYPGEDASNGAVFLYGIDAARPQDVGVVHWKRITAVSDPSILSIVRTAIYDHDSSDWREMMDSVDGGSLHPDTFSVDPTFEVFNGQRLWPEFTYENNGADVQDVTARFFLSPDPFITTGDRQIGQGSLTLHRDWVYQKALPVTLPTDLREETYHYLGVIVDPDNALAEVNEENNASYTKIKTGSVFPISLVLSPSVLSESTAASTGTVELNGHASAGGAAVTLWSSTNLVTVPASVIVPEGQRQAQFSLTADTSSSYQAIITAMRAGERAAAELSVNPFTLHEGPAWIDTFFEDILRFCLAELVGTGGPPRQCAPPSCPECLYGMTPREPQVKMPDHLIRVLQAARNVLLNGSGASPLPAAIDALAKALKQVPKGRYFTSATQRAVAGALTASARQRPLSSATVSLLAQSINAMQLDILLPGPVVKKRAAGRPDTSELDGGATVAIPGLSGNAQLHLLFGNTLPGALDGKDADGSSYEGFEPLWPVVSLRLALIGGADREGPIDISLFTGGYVSRDADADLRLIEWDGTKARDITTQWDRKQQVIRGRTSRLASYVVMQRTAVPRDASKEPRRVTRQGVPQGAARRLFDN